MSLLSPQSADNSLEAKVVVLGSQGVGKTSLVLRHVSNTFTQSVSPTIGASFFTFSMTVTGYRIKLQLWDTAGQERFRSMAPMYYRRANAALIVYDITREKSFEEAQEWVRELESKVDSNLSLCVVGNKCDLSGEREVSREQGLEFAHQIGAMFTETSAAQNSGVKEAFLKVAQGVISLHQHHQLKSDRSFSHGNSYTAHTVSRTFNAVQPSPPTDDTIHIHNTANTDTNSSKCCS
uniref:Rab21-like n=1 Tax=Suberites domuncula TaxID=55567 RepID=A1XKS7_SUBDO|nr:Rab21-like [Suberites domuncula]